MTTRPLTPTKKTTPVSHIWPMKVQFVGAVYQRAGLSSRLMAAALGINYNNFQKRVARLLRACNQNQVMVKVERRGNRYFYYPAVKGLRVHEARRVVKQ